jgi:two-component system sensor histidine kinase RegB
MRPIAAATIGRSRAGRGWRGYNARMTAVSVLTPAATNLRRLLLVRAITVAGLLLTLAFATLRLRMALPAGALLTILGLMVFVSLATLWRLARPWPVRDGELFIQLLLDVAALTALFYLSGGSTNPFVMLYLLPLAFTAAALPGRWVWWMAAVAVGCYGVLFVWHVPLAGSAHAHDTEFGVHVFGMWLGFVLSAGLIAGFSVRMSASLRERDRALGALREQALRQERVVALGTLATGAAHELGTPLSTLAVLAKDIAPGEALSAEKLSILRAQIARCKEILASLSAAAGQVRAESGQRLALDQFLRELIGRWQSMRPGVETRVHLDGVPPAPVIVAEQTLAQAITNILNNAADASPGHVEVDARWTDDELTLEIADRGPGLAPGLASVAGTPFVTTKSDGLGLGLFLAYTTLSRFGGEVRLFDRDGGGVRCRLRLPLAALKLSPT